MGSTAEDVAAVADEEACMYAMQLASSSILPMTLKNALELGLLEVLQKDAGEALAAEEVVARLPVAPTNPGAADMVDRMLRLLASYDVVKCQMEDKDGRRSARSGGWVLWMRRPGRGHGRRELGECGEAAEAEPKPAQDGGERRGGGGRAQAGTGRWRTDAGALQMRRHVGR
ncbi:hypothetical protein BDA96_03G478000 [Sorghum bicolor]|uniref:O-methyltransferase dimerisation domain-containing protein n=1 Tax=Sorghum bicolor TaxID=4558 RepID=A0A921RJ23_SORBI|nr:hypothetical protein BDA96_03G478000 [Sorghum bicolor]